MLLFDQEDDRQVLVEMLKKNTVFKAMSMSKQTIFARLADAFEDNHLALYCDPEDLAAKLNVGNPQQWHEFLQMEPVKAYINAQMSFNADVASRKAFFAASVKASNGDVQAAKHVHEIAGLHKNASNNRTVVMIRVDRPQVVRREGGATT